MPSILQQYMQNYGPRLQSALQSAAPTDATPVTSTAPVVGQGAQTSALQTAPAGAGLVTEQDAPAAEQPASALQPSQASDQQQPKDGLSFGDAWKQLPEKDRAQQLDQLEQTLQKGNQTIDTAYDDMAAKLGTRPGDKLTRDEKGMLLMQFGLSLMQASGSNAYGEDIGAAIGAAGSQTLQSYQGMKSQKRADQDTFDKSQLAIENQRAKAKGDLSAKGAEERTKLTSALIAADEKQGAEPLESVLDDKGNTILVPRSQAAGRMTKSALERTSASEPLEQVLNSKGEVVYVPRSKAAGMRAPKSGSEKGFEQTASDENSIRASLVSTINPNALYNELTGQITGLSQDEASLFSRALERATIIHAQSGGKKTRAQAAAEAIREVKAERQTKPSAAPANAQRKTLNGKTYVKVDGQWYEE